MKQSRPSLLNSTTILINNKQRFFLILILLFMTVVSRSVLALSNRASNSASTNQQITRAMTGSNKKNCDNIIFHWFRGMDLRLHDNPALDRSIKACATPKPIPGSDKNQNHDGHLVPIFCFDSRIYGNDAKSEFGTLKCGPRRAKFVLESIADLRTSLESKGSKLLVAYGKPEDVFTKLLNNHMKQIDDDDDDGTTKRMKIIYQEEVCSEEKSVELKVKKLFPSSQSVWGSTLYDLSDLPYEEGLHDMPDTFTPFRNKVEKVCTIHSPIPVPKQFPSFPSIDDFPSLKEYVTYMPTLHDLGYTKEQIESVQTVDKRGVMEFIGGETAALARVQDYIWDKDLLRKYFDTRNGMIGADYSSKFAPWLATGNLSPRYVAKECTKYEQERIANKSTYWLIFELLWRDFFKFFALKHGPSIFFPSGTVGDTKKQWKHYDKNLQAWMDGKTGFPLVDANMRELAATGFMSNRGRQNVCSFLALELNQDWRYGADYFESTLLDYDVHSNWGNWCSGAGMTGGRLNRFNIVKQSKDYDQHGDYVRHWLPELRDVPTQFVHEPWKMNQFQQLEYNCRIGVDYPNPIAKPFYPSPKNGSNSKGGHRGGGGGGNQQGGRRGNNKNKNNGKNPNRGRGQRQDMKSLKQGNFQMD